MSKEKIKTILPLCIETGVVCMFLICSFSPFVKSFHTENKFLNDSPPDERNFNQPYETQHLRVLNKFQTKERVPLLESHPTISVEEYLQIEPSDAIDRTKYSQPAVSHEQYKSNINSKVPTIAEVNDEKQTISPDSSSSSNSHKYSSLDTEFNSSKTLRDLRFLESVSDFKNSEKLDFKEEDRHLKENFSNSKTKENNFTDSFTNLLSEPSDTVLSYENLSSSSDKSTFKNVPVKKSIKEAVLNESSHIEDTKSVNAEQDLVTFTTQLATEPSEEPNTHVFINLINHTTTTDIFPSFYDENISSSSPSLESERRRLSSGAVAGIVIAVLVCVTLLSSTVIYLLYRKYNGKCSSVVEGKFNSDNCGYLDDSLRSSIYLNNHIELPKESSEEMSSLDNDSFLNSLETMTIQNYWADNSKNTKV